MGHVAVQTIQGTVSMSEYPKVMRYGPCGVVVKFTAYGVGTVIATGNLRRLSEQVIGYHSTTWYMQVFIDYKVEIIETKE